MLRLVLLVLYLIAASSAAPQTKQSGDPLGLHQPSSPTTDAGGGYDPNGAK